MGRAPCCEKSGLKKGPWTPEEDEKLVAYIKRHGQGNWRTLPKNAGLARCGKSCRLRWTNYLRPDIKRGRFSFEEETIIQLHSILGNNQAQMAQQAAAALAAHQQVAPPPQQQADHQFMQQQAACHQMPDLVHASPTALQQLAAADVQAEQHRDMCAPACHSMHPPTGFGVNGLDDVPAALLQMVQPEHTSNLQQQWSISTASTSSNNNNTTNVGSGVSTPSSSPVARFNHSTSTAATATPYGGASASIDDDAALFNMQLSELLDVSDYM